MSVLPRESHAINSEPLWYTSNYVPEVSEAISTVIGVGFTRAVNTATTNVILAQFSFAEAVSEAKAYGNIQVTNIGTNSTAVGNLYLSVDPSGLTVGNSNMFTGISLGGNTYNVVLDGLTTYSATPFQVVYLIYSVTTPFTSTIGSLVVGPAMASFTYANATTYSGWTFTPGGGFVCVGAVA